MRNPYEVTLWKRGRTTFAEPIATRRFKNLYSAQKWGNKINAKHCACTNQTYRNRNVWVDIYKDGQGCIEEIEPIIVPSVGELGYW